MIGRWGRGPVARVGLAALLVLYGLPLVYLVATSFKDRSEIFRAPASLLFSPDLSAYRDVWGADLPRHTANSAVIAFGVTALIVVLSTPAAYWLSRGRGAAVNLGLAGLILLQMVPQSTSVIPLFRIMGRWGLLGGLHSVVVADTALLLPFAVILLRPFFAAVPLELEEAAQVDGASLLQTFLRVDLPLARNGILTVATLVWIIAWGEFLYAITFLTDNDRLPLSGLLGQQISQFGVDWDRLMALAVLVALPVLVVFAATERRLAEGLVLGAGK